MLAIVHRGIAVPIFWVLLNKRGNSNTRERIALMQRFIKVFGKQSIQSILADREFVGNEWFSWLENNQIPFHIRIKKNTKIPHRNKQTIQIQQLFFHLKLGESQQCPRSIKISDVSVYVCALRLNDGELLIIASNNRTDDAIKCYRKRWEIETLFSCLKGRGFDLEATHLTKLSRVKKLVAIHAIAFCWAYYVGIWSHTKVAPIKVKSHGRLEKSIFRLGLDLLQEALKHTLVFKKNRKILRYINMLTKDILRW